MKMSNRAYSLLEIKAFDEEKREITGVATTPSTDRVGDIVEPLGAKFAAEMPLLWQHQHDKPVGTAKFEKPTKDGIKFKATLPFIDEPGPLKDMVDMAWQSVKAKLVRAVSIGFRPIEYSFMDSGGIRFSETEIYELSLVTIPAQSEATIQTVKSIDTALRASSGEKKSDEDERGKPPAPPPGVSGTKQPATGGFFYARKKEQKMDIAKQIATLEAKRKELSEERVEIQAKASEAGVTKDAEQQTRFDEITVELTAVDKELGDLKLMEKDVVGTARTVNGQSQDDANKSRAPAIVNQLSIKSDEPGQMFARHALCIFAAKGNTSLAAQLAVDNYGAKSPVAKALVGMGGRNVESVLGNHMATKATINAGTTADATWAGPLLAYNNYSQDFVDFLRPRTILGQFGTNGIPAARRVPFNVHIKGQTSGGMGYWVGQGAPKPVTKFDYNDVYFGWFKVAGISVVTDELIRFSDPAVELLVRDGLADALVERMNIDFIDPAFAGSANVSPASILSGANSVAASGTGSAADIRTDILALQAIADDANNPMDTPVFIMRPQTAAAVGMLQNPLGQSEYPGLTRRGGTLMGIPVITSNYVPADTAGTIVALVNASDIWYADDGQATVDFSNQASIQMLDNPTNNSATGTATSLVSMFQTDSTAIRAHRFANWKRRRESSFAYLTGVQWGADQG